MVVGIFQAGFDFYPIVGFVIFTAINASPDIEFALYSYINVFYACFLMPVMLLPIVSRDILFIILLLLSYISYMYYIYSYLLWLLLFVLLTFI